MKNSVERARIVNKLVRAGTPAPAEQLMADQLTLLETIMHNPFRLVNGDELKFILGKSQKFVMALKKAGAPFPGGVTRPEWILGWLENHPKFHIKGEVD